MRIRIDEAALRAVITPQVAVDAMREAFRADGDGRAHVPAVINLDVPAHRGEFHVKTALHRRRAARGGEDRQRLLRQSGERAAERIRA